MAEVTNATLGSLSGKVGTVVAANWRDIAYLRGTGRKRKNAPTEKQEEVRMKFSLMTDFLGGLKGVIEAGFKYKYTGRATALNLGVKANMAAFTGTYPDLQINYPAIVFSAGKLGLVTDAALDSTEPKKLSLTWKPLTEAAGNSMADELTVVIYNPRQKLLVVLEKKAVRGDLSLEISLPDSFEGEEVFGYLFLTGAQSKRNSPTAFLGSVVVL